MAATNDASFARKPEIFIYKVLSVLFEPCKKLKTLCGARSRPRYCQAQAAVLPDLKTFYEYFISRPLDPTNASPKLDAL
jgi:hypothetical protein